MTLTKLCSPALIYLVFSITQITIDTIKGMYNTALIKIVVTFSFTILLNYLCQLGLGIGDVRPPGFVMWQLQCRPTWQTSGIGNSRCLPES